MHAATLRKAGRCCRVAGGNGIKNTILSSDIAMFSAFERLVAFRYLRSRRAEGFISVIAGFSLTGIALGVATLIVVMAVMKGFREELLGRILGMKGHITVYGQGRALDKYELLSQELLRIEGVKTVLPLVEGQVMASFRGRAQGAQVNGLRAADLPKKPLLQQAIVEGGLEAFANGEGVMIGKRMAENLGIRLGDQLTLISPEGRATIAGLMPRLKAYPVVALFDAGMYEYDSGLVVMPFGEAQEYFKLRDAPAAAGGGLDAATGIELFTADVNRAQAIGRAIAQEYGPRVRVYDWQQSNAHFFNAVQVERNVMFLILTLIILVAAFNIISSLIMLVKSKGRDVAILRTMGATRGMIARIFFLCGASIGVIGTFAGVALGLGFALNIAHIQHWLEGLTGTELFAAEIYFLSSLPAVVDPKEVLTVVAMALSLSLLATLYPAWRAARLNPAEALRYE